MGIMGVYGWLCGFSCDFDVILNGILIGFNGIFKGFSRDFNGILMGYNGI